MSVTKTYPGSGKSWFHFVLVNSEIRKLKTKDSTPVNSRLNVLVRSPTPLGWVKMAVDFFEGSRYPGHLPLCEIKVYFLLVYYR